MHISKWAKALTLLVVLGGLLIGLPNALSDRALARLPSWFPHDRVNLGLDLQGGSYLLEQVDIAQVRKDRGENLLGDIRDAFRKANIPASDMGFQGDTVTVRVADPGLRDGAARLIDGVNPEMQTSVGAKDYEVTRQGGLFTLRMSDAYKTATQRQVLAQSMVVVRRRIDAMGVREPDISPQGTDRIAVQVPGLQDPERLKELLGKTAKMSFHLVDDNADPNNPTVPVGDQVLPLYNKNKNAPVEKVLVQRRIMVSGERLTSAAAGFDQQTGQPIVSLHFDSVGAREFADMTRDNINHRFAVVLDNQVLTDPNIQQTIPGGNGQISGSFTPQSANDLAVLLNAGALPAPLLPVEENTVGAELGQDSIKAGRVSTVSGLALVGVFMTGRYGLFGLFANVALIVNIVLLLAALSLLGATLTLPGIAGIVLTMGMAVDANVLIYERIREEQRNGRGIWAAVDVGFKRATATIIDANMTHVIAAMILFELASGPVQGFAVTLLIGILSSFFTAVMVTRLMVVMWLNAAKPKKLVI